MEALLAGIPPQLIIAGAIGLVAVLIAEALYLVYFTARQYRSNVNRRLKLYDAVTDRAEALVQLKRERGLSADGGYVLWLKSLNDLILQSGLTIGVGRVVVFWAASLVLVPVLGLVFLTPSWTNIGASIAVGLFLPLLILKKLRARRIMAFTTQLPDAIDIIVRSIRAGHPVPIAISMVAREMPDPVGTEFGIVADEMSYGLDLESALRNMQMRVGQEDLPLFVTSVSIQSSTGGNLSEILDNLSKVIRGRFKMRRKIKSLSAEGRFSAIVIGSMPPLIALAVNAMQPTFFEPIWSMNATPYVIAGSVFWMGIGVMIMRSMINFRV
jgi:tight adherence protein B